MKGKKEINSKKVKFTELNRMFQSSIIGLGTGIYSVSEMSEILRVPYFKINRWLNKYWDNVLSNEFQTKFSLKIESSKVVSFQTMIEFYVTYQLSSAGVKMKNIIQARIELTKITNSQHPFAQKNVINNIRTDGNKVFFEFGESDTLSLDGTKQLNISFIRTFFKNLDFDNELIATRYWPLGKSKNIIVDPNRQFGHPVIGKTNIYPEIINSLYQAGEPINFIASIYNLAEQDVKDAIEFCNAA